jgi:general stress protein 26
MRVSSFTEIEAEFIERAHRMVWCDMATVGPDDRPRTHIVHPLWEGDTAWITSLRDGPKAADIDRRPFVSLAYVSEPVKPAYAECVASWVADRDERIAIWKRIAAIPEPLGNNTETMFGSYDVPNLTMLRLRP